MFIRNIQKDDLDIHYFKLLSELSPSLDIDLTEWYKEKIQENFDKLWSDFVDNKNHHIIVAFSVFSPYVAATASLLIENKINGKNAAHIEDVVVSKVYRGLGLGGAMIKRLIDVARDKECYKIILNCSDKNVPFYDHLGFTKIDNGMKLVL